MKQILFKTMPQQFDCEKKILIEFDNDQEQQQQQQQQQQQSMVIMMEPGELNMIRYNDNNNNNNGHRQSLNNNINNNNYHQTTIFRTLSILSIVICVLLILNLCKYWLEQHEQYAIIPTTNSHQQQLQHINNLQIKCPQFNNKN